MEAISLNLPASFKLHSNLHNSTDLGTSNMLKGLFDLVLQTLTLSWFESII